MTGRSGPSSASHHDPSGQGSSAAGSTPTSDHRAPGAGGPDELSQAAAEAPALGNAAAAFIAAGRDAAPKRPNPAVVGEPAGRTGPEPGAAAPASRKNADEPSTTSPAPRMEPAAGGVRRTRTDPLADASHASAAAPDTLDASSPVPEASAAVPDTPAAAPAAPAAPATALDAAAALNAATAVPDASAAVADTRATAPDPPQGDAAQAADPLTSGFRLRLSNFEGPFDLLLTLISSRKLDVTEVALHKVTDEFIAYTKALTANMAQQNTLRSDKILDQTTEFLVVAATLLDLKAARLLPSGEMTDAEDLELLEARDLLFARLLQYRAFKQVAELLAELEAAALRRYPRAVGLEERYADLLPEVTLGVGAAEFAAIAAAAFRPRPVPKVGLDHLHTHAISVAEQAALVLERLKQRGAGAWTSFGELVADCEVPVQIVARFLALLELYRGKTIEFDQPDPLGPLSVSWIGDEAAQQVDTMTIEEDYG